MPTKLEFIACKTLSRAQLHASGACRWPLKWGSPGFELRIPHGTSFRIRLEGPQSHVYVHGECSDGLWRVRGGSGRGTYDSANAAVTAARRSDHTENSNAYLFVEFRIDERWVLADDLRRFEEYGVPRQQVNIEDWALRQAEDLIREIAKDRGVSRSREQVRVWAEKRIEEDPQFIERAQEFFSSISDLSRI